jgi:hypothetical protein
MAEELNEVEAAQAALKAAKAKAREAEKAAKAEAREAERAAKAKAREEEKVAKAKEKARAKREDREAEIEARRNYADISNWYQTTVYRAPEFEDSKINDVDRALLTKIRYSYNPVDHSAMILINTKGHTWTPVLLDSKAAKEIARVCAQSEPNNVDKYKTLADELYEKTTGLLSRLFKAFGARQTGDAADQDELIKAVIDRMPGSMLKAYNIGCLISKEVVRANPNDEESDAEMTISRPHAAWFADKAGSSDSRKDIFNHLAENASMYLRRPEFVVPMPKLLTNDPNETALHYIDLDSITADGDWPTWKQFYKRYPQEEAKLHRAFMWGVFKADNHSRQMLYNYDPDGFSAKSVVANAIRSQLGDELVAAIQKDSLNNQFSMAKVYDKRLVIISDNKNAYLVRSEKAHMMLGGDPADIERKGRDSFTSRLQLKIMASGNTQLVIDPDATHERTRVIVLHPKVNDDVLKEIALTDKDGNVIRNKYGRVQLLGDPSFEKRLIEEFPMMLTQAKKDYEELCPTDGNYILPPSVEESLEMLSEDNADIVDNLIKDTFEFRPDYHCGPEVLKEEYNFFPDYVREDYSYNQLIEHLTKKYGIRKKTVRVGDAFPKHYVGIRKKEAK